MHVCRRREPRRTGASCGASCGRASLAGRVHKARVLRAPPAVLAGDTCLPRARPQVCECLLLLPAEPEGAPGASPGNALAQLAAGGSRCRLPQMLQKMPLYWQAALRRATEPLRSRHGSSLRGAAVKVGNHPPPCLLPSSRSPFPIRRPCERTLISRFCLSELGVQSCEVHLPSALLLPLSLERPSSSGCAYTRV